MRLAALARLLCVFVLALALATPAHAATRVKLLVLDVKSKDLSASEVETLTSLITAHLSRYPQLDVLSSVDIKRLVDLEAQKQSAGCDAGACLSEIAGALGADLVIFGQAGKLGSTIVLTLNIFDSKKNEAVGRQPVEVRDIGQLPALVGPAIDSLVKPLFQSLRAGGPGVGPAGGDTLHATPNIALTARAREVFDQQQMDVCVDEGDRLKWWFCDKKERHTENAFVRQYRALTGQHDLDKYEENRNKDGLGIPGALLGGGSLLFLAGLPIAYYTYVDTTTVPALSAKGSDGNSIGGLLSISALAVGAGSAIYGGILMAGALKFTDGELQDHTMREAEARDAAGRYNEALAAKIGKEYGTAP